MSVVPGFEGESDVAAEGKKGGFGGGADNDAVRDWVADEVLEDSDDVVVVGGGVGVGENRLVRGLLMALDLVGMDVWVKGSQTVRPYLYSGPKELSMDR